MASKARRSAATRSAGTRPDTMNSRPSFSGAMRKLKIARSRGFFEKIAGEGNALVHAGQQRRRQPHDDVDLAVAQPVVRRVAVQPPQLPSTSPFSTASRISALPR